MKRDEAARQKARSSPGKAPASARSRTAQPARAREAAPRTPGQRAALLVVSMLIFSVGVPIVKGLHAWEQLATKGRPRPV